MKITKLFRYLIPLWKKAALALSLGGLGMVAGLVNPYLTKLIIDRAYGNRDLKLFITLTVAAGLIFILGGLVAGLAGYLNRYIHLRISLQLNRQVFKKL